MSVETMARRYASALADVLGNNYAEVSAELKSWEEMMGANPDLTTAFKNPAIAHINKENLLEGLIEKTKPSPTTANFLKVLLQNGRLVNLPDINQTLSKVIEERSGVVAARITSARELSDAEKKELQSGIEKMTGKRASLNFGVNKELIGGVVTTIGSTVYDGSVKTQLENLKQELVNG